MTKFKTLDDLGDITGKVALVRVDLNLPMQDGAVTDDTRVRASAPTIRDLCAKGAKVLLLAHFGRPKGARNSEQSLSMVVGCVEQVLGKEVMFVPEIAGDVVKQAVGILRPGDVAILENTRFWPGEEKNDPELAKAIAANGDMLIDTDDIPPYFSDPRNGFVLLRDTLMHEHGHGMGMLHSCSNNSNILMAPFINTAFDGPQQDDIRSVQSLYGDVNGASPEPSTPRSTMCSPPCLWAPGPQ